ncbi:ATP-binding protein [Streptomyces sp. NPDC049687]|uniref:ATP-binding protein n=1 Tax=Streptomyces sp. NPDC049687 TaxID=3365596 RepID=UPI0037AB4CEB
MQLEIRPDPAEVGRARRWARSRLAGSGIGDDESLAETLILLVSELVTNAVVHTGCPAVVRLSLPGGGPGAVDGAATVRLEVADTSDRAPVPRCVGDDATGGRGLALVDCLADRWGWSVEGGGKRIWCELDRCEEPAESAADLGSVAGHGGAVECRSAADRESVTDRRGTAFPEPVYSKAPVRPEPAFEGRAFEVV